MSRLEIDLERESTDDQSEESIRRIAGALDADADAVEPGAHPSTLLTRSFLIGAAVGMVSLLFVLFGGAASLLQKSSAGAMYDAQAHSLLDGRWDVPASAAGIEAFGFGGRSYLYFGPFPAILRIPLLLFTDRFDGRLGQLSILVAVVVTVIAVAKLVNEVARRYPTTEVVGRFGRGMMMLLGAVTTGGSIITFLAFRGDIYNEAIAWGLATTMMSMAALLGALRLGSTRLTLAAGVFAMASISSRITLGVSAVSAIALVLLCTTTARSRAAFGIADVWAQRRQRIALVIAVALPLAVFLGVQAAKFGTPVVRPSNHLVNLGRPDFADYVAENGDTYFRPEFVPSNFLNTTIWPTSFDLDASFPWLRPVDMDIGPNPADARFLGRSWSGSLLVTQTLLFGLALVGAWSLVKRARSIGTRLTPPGSPRLDGVAVVIVGSSVGFVGTLAYAYQYHRFLADGFPTLLILAAIGTIAVVSRPPSSRLRRLSIAGSAVTLAIWSAWTNVATAIVSQTERVWAPTPAAFNRLIALEDTFGGDLGITNIPIDQPLGAPSDIGSVLVIGECDALLAAAGQDGFGALWWPVEMGSAYRSTFDFDPTDLPRGETLLSTDSIPATPPTTIAIVVGDEGRSTIVLRSGGLEQFVDVDPSAGRLTLDVNPIWTTLTATVGDDIRTLTWAGHLDIPELPAAIQRGGGSSMSLCRRVAEMP